MLNDKNPLDIHNEYFQYLKSDHYLFSKQYLDREQIVDKSSGALILLLGEPNFENKLSTFLAQEFNVNTSAYDRAIDSIYNSTKIGGSTLHHNLDGAHTFEGALNILRQHFPNDSDFKLALESISHLSRDLTTPSGINPFLTPDNFQQSKDYLIHHLDMSASSANDLLNINAVELGGALIATMAVIYNLGNDEIDKMGEYFSRISLVSLISGNPALLMLSFILMGQSLIQLIKQKEFLKFIDGATAGTLSTISFFYATVAVSGHLFPVLLIGLLSSFGTNLIYNKTKSLLRDDLDDIFLSIFPAYKSYLKLI